MNAYFFKMNKEERNNILDQHKQVYDGYVTRYNQESNMTPLYVQDLANDKNGITVNNKGIVKNYTNMSINESNLDRIADGPDDLKNGTEDLGDSSDEMERNYYSMHDSYPSPGYDDESYISLGKNSIDDDDNLDIVIDFDMPEDRFEYDIDELEDFSSDFIHERFHETDPEEEDSFGDEYVDDSYEMFKDVDEDILPELTAKLQESWEMFERFKKYN